MLKFLRWNITLFLVFTWFLLNLLKSILIALFFLKLMDICRFVTLYLIWILKILIILILIWRLILIKIWVIFRCIAFVFVVYMWFSLYLKQWFYFLFKIKILAAFNGDYFLSVMCLRKIFLYRIFEFFLIR